MSPDHTTPVFRATLRGGALIIIGRVGVSECHAEPFLEPIGADGETLVLRLGYRVFHHSTHAIAETPQVFEHRVGAAPGQIRRVVIKLYNDEEWVIERTRA